MSSYDKEIRSRADAALSAVQPQTAQATELMKIRVRVYDWLEGMNNLCKDTSSCVSAHAEVVALRTGVPLESVRAVLESFLKDAFPKGCIASREEDELFWTPTSFVFDPECRSLNAKIGKLPYQPFAFDDGKHLVLTDAAKLLWARKWAITLASETASPFDVIKNTEMTTIVSAMFLSEQDLKMLKHAFQELQDELGQYLAKVGTEQKDEAEYRLRETVKLARIWSQVLDAKLTSVTKASPDLGSNFENTDIGQVARASLEYMAMRIDGHLAAVKEAQTSLQIPDMKEEDRQSLVVYLSELRRILRAPVIDREQLQCIYNRVTSIVHMSPSQEDIVISAFNLYNQLAPRYAADALTDAPVGTDDSHGSGPATVSTAPAASGPDVGPTAAGTGAA